MKNFIFLLLFLLFSKNLFSQDIGLTSLNLNGYAELSSTIYCVVKNDGGLVTDFKVSFSIDGGPATTETVYTANITSPQRWWFPLSNPAVFSSNGSHVLRVWTSMPNGAADSDPSDDSINQTLTVLQYAPQKMVMLDRFVGEWGGYCPDADLKSRDLADIFSNRVIQVAYHDGDPMAIPEGLALESFFNVNGWPEGMIDRFEFSWQLLPGEVQDRFGWMTQIDERLKYVVPADVVLSDYSFDPYTKEFSVTVTTNFYGAANDAFQLDLVITEDSIISQGQHNYYNVPGAVNPDNPELNNIGDPIVNYAHMNVAREVLGAPSLTVPTSIPPSGGTYSYTFTGTLGSTWDEQHINYIGMLYRNTGLPEQSEVINCRSLKAQCAAGFYLVADTIIPHHYWAVNTAVGNQPLNYVWNWGDGSSDSIAYPSHTYAVGGYYTICLSIHDSTGCFDSICIPYDIQKLSEENTIITVDVVDSIPDITSAISNVSVMQSWSVFPNPAAQNVFVNYSLSTSAAVKIELYDVLGNKIQEISDDADAGEHLTIIDMREFSNGVYYLKISAAQEIISEKLVLIK